MSRSVVFIFTIFQVKLEISILMNTSNSQNSSREIIAKMETDIIGLQLQVYTAEDFFSRNGGHQPLSFGTKFRFQACAGHTEPGFIFST